MKNTLIEQSYLDHFYSKIWRKSSYCKKFFHCESIGYYDTNIIIFLVDNFVKKWNAVPTLMSKHTWSVLLIFWKKSDNVYPRYCSTWYQIQIIPLATQHVYGKIFLAIFGIVYVLKSWKLFDCYPTTFL